MESTSSMQKSIKRIVTLACVAIGLSLLIADPALGLEKVLPEESLSIWKAVIFGFVEGLTEFLPISSTGHLLATKEILNVGETELSEEAIDSYIISIQIGAIFAVAVLYRQRLLQMLQGLFGRNSEGKKMAGSLIAAVIPTAVIGLVAADFVKDNLYSLWPVAAAWIAGGVSILAIDRQNIFNRPGKRLEELTAQEAFLIGLIQALALWPGVSRSLVTIIAAVLVGLSLKAAVEFSFILGLVTLTAATVFELGTDGQQVIDSFGYTTPIIGLCVAFVAAVISIRFMVEWLEQRSFAIFGFYRLFIGFSAIILIFIGYF